MLDGSRAQLWIHGHTHDSFDYVVNGTRVVCNPRGIRAEMASTRMLGSTRTSASKSNSTQPRIAFHEHVRAERVEQPAKARRSLRAGQRCAKRAPNGAASMLAATITAIAGR